jgi:hypothetical protein
MMEQQGKEQGQAPARRLPGNRKSVYRTRANTAPESDDEAA